MLQASAEIVVADAGRILREICEHFAEHGEVSVDSRGRGEVRLGFGSARLGALGTRLFVETEAADETCLAYMKMGVAEHVHQFARAAVAPFRWTGDGTADAVPPFFREMRVVSAETLTPHMRRIRLVGERLQRFSDGGLHVRLVFPPKNRIPVWPRLGEDGRIVWPEGEDRLDHRIYTIRRIDPAAGVVDIDIVLHAGEETPGSRFATGARPGDVVGMTGPGGGTVPEASSLLLLGDETALPAIARILEALPPAARARAFIEVEDDADEMALGSDAAAEVTYLHRRGRAAGTSGLLPAALRRMDFEPFGPDLFVWAGCGFEDFRAIRGHLRKDRALPRERHLAVAYWRREAEGGSVAD